MFVDNLFLVGIKVRIRYSVTRASWKKRLNQAVPWIKLVNSCLVNILIILCLLVPQDNIWYTKGRRALLFLQQYHLIHESPYYYLYFILFIIYVMNEIVFLRWVDYWSKHYQIVSEFVLVKSTIPNIVKYIHGEAK